MSVKSLNEVLRRVNRGSRTRSRRRFEGAGGEGEISWKAAKKALSNAGFPSDGMKWVSTSTYGDEYTDSSKIDIEELYDDILSFYSGSQSKADDIWDKMDIFSISDESHARTRGGAGRRGRSRGRKEDLGDRQMPWVDIRDWYLSKHLTDAQIEKVYDDFEEPSYSDELNIDSVIGCVEEFFGSSVAEKVRAEFASDESHARTRGGAGRRGRSRGRRRFEDDGDLQLPWGDIKNWCLDKILSPSQVKEVADYFDNPSDTDEIVTDNVEVAIEKIAGSSLADKAHKEFVDWD